MRMVMKNGIEKAVILFIMLFFFNVSASGQSKMKIGVYDSRAVAVAYHNSDYGKNINKKGAALDSEYKKAKTENDTVAVKKLKKRGMLMQAMMHEKGFGTGSVRYEVMEIKEKIDSLAKADGYSLIVSKWELNYTGSDVELVDITEKVASLFNPNERFKKVLQSLLQNEPVQDAYLIDD